MTWFYVLWGLAVIPFIAIAELMKRSRDQWEQSAEEWRRLTVMWQHEAFKQRALANSYAMILAAQGLDVDVTIADQAPHDSKKMH